MKATELLRISHSMINGVCVVREVSSFSVLIVFIRENKLSKMCHPSDQ